MTSRLMTVSYKLRKKKVIPFAVLVIEKEKKLYAEIYYPKQNIVDINHARLQKSQQKLAEILQSKRKVFCIKAIIWKLEKETKYTLPESFIKKDQGFNLVIINARLNQRLGLKIRPTNTLALHHLGMSVANRDFQELKNWVKF